MWEEVSLNYTVSLSYLITLFGIDRLFECDTPDLGNVFQLTTTIIRHDPI
jgi:hypothetical protein